MLQITEDETLSIQTTENKKNWQILSGIAKAGSGGVVKSFENLSTAIKLAKFKKSDFAKTNFGMDFLILGAKKAFIHLQKTFTEAPILRYFDPEYHIWIETNTLGYTIGVVLS